MRILWVEKEEEAAVVDTAARKKRASTQIEIKIEPVSKGRKREEPLSSKRKKKSQKNRLTVPGK